MHTPESIEALEAADVLLVRNTARELHEALPGALDMLSIPDVENEQSLRKAMSLKLSESINHLDSQIADLEAIKKELRIAKGYQSSDWERIKSHLIGLYIARKEDTPPRKSGPSADPITKPTV